MSGASDMPRRPPRRGRKVTTSSTISARKAPAVPARRNADGRVLICWNGETRAPARAEDAHYDGLADLPFTQGFLPQNGIAALKDELVFQRAVQSYLWALPALNMYGMKEGSEKGPVAVAPSEGDGKLCRAAAEHLRPLHGLRVGGECRRQLGHPSYRLLERRPGERRAQAVVRPAAE